MNNNSTSKTNANLEAIKQIATQLWQKRKDFQYLHNNAPEKLEKLLVACGDIYAKNPALLKSHQNAKSIIAPFLTVLSYCRDRIQADTIYIIDDGFWFAPRKWLKDKQRHLIEANDYFGAANLSIGIKALNLLFNDYIKLSSQILDEYTGDIFSIDFASEQKLPNKNDLKLKYSKEFLHSQASLKNIVLHLEKLQMLTIDEQKHNIDWFMQQTFQLYLDFFQHFSEPAHYQNILNENEKEIIIQALPKLQKYYADEAVYIVDRDYPELENTNVSYTGYAEPNRIWKEIAIARSNIEAFNDIFSSQCNLDHIKLLETMLDSSWTCSIQNEWKPDNIPATHWWWFT